jgi:hypothetical protein
MKMPNKITQEANYNIYIINYHNQNPTGKQMQGEVEVVTVEKVCF